MAEENQWQLATDNYVAAEPQDNSQIHHAPMKTCLNFHNFRTFRLKWQYVLKKYPQLKTIS